jgi:hypothetical protein
MKYEKLAGVPSKIRIAVNSVHTTYVWDDDKRGSRGFGWPAGGLGPINHPRLSKINIFAEEEMVDF